MADPQVLATPIVRHSATEAVREEILRLIRQGAFPVGSRLPSEHELAAQFAVSRPVIREALGSLRLAKVVESRTGAGTFVRARQLNGLLLGGRYTPEELYEVRRHLEIPGAALAAERRSAAQLRELETIVERHAHCSSVAEWVNDDLMFHVTLAEATQNSLQSRLVAELRELQFEQSVATAARLGGLDAPKAEHRAIVEAVRRRDRPGAEAAMAAHLDAILVRAHTQPQRDL